MKHTAILFICLLALCAAFLSPGPAVQAGDASIEACAGDCALPYTWQPLPGQGVVLVELVFADRSISFTWPGTIDGYTVTGVAVFYENDPVTVSGPGLPAPDRVRVRLEPMPTPAPWCEPPAQEIHKWWCENGTAIPVRETFLPIVLR